MLEFAKIVGLELGTRVRTLLATLRANGTEGQDDDAEPMDRVEVIQPHGFVSRPATTSTLEAVYARVGDEFVCIGMLDKGSAAFNPTVESGEVRVYTAGGSYVRLYANGDIELLPKAGKDIYIGNKTGAVPIALGNAIDTHLGLIKVWLDGHTHADPVSGFTGPANAASGPSPSPPDVQADHAFVQPT